MIVYYISCNAPNNLIEQYYVDTMFARTSEHAANSAIAGASSRNHKVGAGRKSLTTRTSLKQ
jgi:hypothetical protein